MKKWTLFFLIFAVCPNLYATAELGDIVTSSDSKPILMEFEDAEEFCHDMAMRLPTAREYASFAQPQGATGIRESKFRNQPIQSSMVRAESSKNAKEGFARVDKLTTSGRIVPDFYYSPKGFRHSRATPQTVSWSNSSPNALPHDSQHSLRRPARQTQVLRYAFDETRGDLKALPEDTRLAVRCVPE
jgi:hypothetical protein